MRWKANVASSLTDVWHQLFEQPDITLKKIVFRVPKITRTLCEIKGVMWEYSYEGKHLEKRHAPPTPHHTSAPVPGDQLKPTRRNMFIRNQRGTSMS